MNWETVIREYLDAGGHAIEFFVLTGTDDAKMLQDRIGKFSPDRVVAVGGDGTITFVAKQLMNTPIAMGILPAGSANGMAFELKIPEETSEALGIIIGNCKLRIDLLEINNDICLHMSDIGLNARLIKYFEEGTRRGKWGYLRVIFKTLWKKQVIYVTIQTRDVEIKRRAFSVVLANGSRSGFGAVVNPEGNIGDGYFEVVIVRRLAISELFKMWFRPQPFNPKKIEVIKAKSVNIECLHPTHFQIDGEYIGKVSSVRARVLPACLNLLFPSASNKCTATM